MPWTGYSSIQIREENVLDGGMEELMIDGVSDVIEKLKLPAAGDSSVYQLSAFFLSLRSEAGIFHPAGAVFGYPVCGLLYDPRRCAKAD